MNRARTDDQLYRQQAIKTVKRVYAKTEREEKENKRIVVASEGSK